MIMSPACYWCCDAKEASTHSSAASGDSLKPFCPYTFGADRSSLRRIILIYQKNGLLLQKHFTISCGGGVTVSHQLLSFARLRIRGEKSCFFYVSTGSFLIILVFRFPRYQFSYAVFFFFSVSTWQLAYKCHIISAMLGPVLGLTVTGHSGGTDCSCAQIALHSRQKKKKKGSAVS